jgi:hypothetical protein
MMGFMIVVDVILILMVAQLFRYPPDPPGGGAHA